MYILLLSLSLTLSLFLLTPDMITMYILCTFLPLSLSLAQAKTEIRLDHSTESLLCVPVWV